MPSDVFTLIAEPNRRAILDLLRTGPATVGQLVERLDLSQPTVSKHLRVLRENQIVEATVAAQSRIYRLNAAPLAELDSWLQPYRRLWERSFTRLGEHLDRRQDADRTNADWTNDDRTNADRTNDEET
ncbi:helix-turn-helix transcriptional regulator [Microlunatus sp. Gsoil 973]|uniref:ArsR/SmtB family transcription factor n=1 Tax=Microlunatus sp. Gsoil 973 TaxID=2672569 RepID=UPI0012B4A9DE|nr:metalloregulator ArsR/SmtB family transcription factor [Microlunatus sp. Gsoil 973]QGN33478.1 metalloregulator ArsR/SmtB family transcription factor [Microlunatus sp. Gsoil 973]